ncbi:MAG: calcium-binding protein [Pseudomonadota bacterium]
MASIIPGPGVPPAVAPLAVPVSQSVSFTIAADATVLGQDIDRLFQIATLNATLTNRGTLWATTVGARLVLASGAGLALDNGGLIHLRGHGQVTLIESAGPVTNRGAIFLISDVGAALGLGGSPALQMANTGLLAVQSLQGDATGIEAGRGAAIVNGSSGRILVEGEIAAAAIKLVGGGDPSAAPARIENSGLIEAHVTGSAAVSLGIVAAERGAEGLSIYNSGTIRADVAILGWGASDAASGGAADLVSNLGGGTLNGQVWLGPGHDVLDNAGVINGDVLLGAGADIFTNAGTVNGFVDLGWDNDSYRSLNGDGRVAAGRGDDTIAGGGGDDLLLGGFGNDWIGGGNGNDGLIGEWGNDTIVTSGGDAAEGGEGDDQIVLGDLSFARVSGGNGRDTLVLPAQAAIFDLGKLVGDESRVTSIEAIELRAGQTLAINFATFAATPGSAQPFAVLGGMTSRVILDARWVRGADAVLDDGVFRQWVQAGITIQIAEAISVTSGSVPAPVGLAAVASGPSPPVPGAAAGLDYTSPDTFLSGCLIAADLIVDEAERFVSAGPVAVFMGAGLSLIENHGTISAFNRSGVRATGLELADAARVINFGTIEAAASGPGPVAGQDRAVGIRAGAGAIVSNGSVLAQSTHGHSVAVETYGSVTNSGTIQSVAPLGTAIGVECIGAGSEATSRLSNAGLIYAVGGGGGGTAAIGADVAGSLTNDGRIYAGRSAGADPASLAYGIVLTAVGARAHLINNGEIEGDVAIAARSTDAQVFLVTNHGRIIGDVVLGANADTFDGRDGSVDGTVRGMGGSDRISGGAGHDEIDGGSGDDLLGGGYGNDTYYVDSQADLVFEAAGQGNDSVVASAGHYLFANVENLLLAESAGDIFGVGNDLANTLVGNAGNNLLLGGNGDDFVRGDAGTDALFGQDGNDRLSGDDGIDYLVGGAGGDILDGGNSADALYGGEGDDALHAGADFVTDILDGGSGNDVLYANSGLADYDLVNGGAGNDTYFVDTGADLTFEAAAGGIDTVFADVPGINNGVYLYANVENLVLSGVTAFGVGNELGNSLTGNAAANLLLGGAGSDRLNGKVGADILFGQAGNDRFGFESGTGADVIGDFRPAEDRIELIGSYSTFDQLASHFIQVGADGAIDLGHGDLIVLHGVTMSNLTATDFVLL